MHNNQLIKSGKQKIAWAYENMPVLKEIQKDFVSRKPFKNKTIAVSVHVEAKTACLAKVLADGGAIVYITGCNPLSTQDDVAAALATEDNIHVFCKYGANEEEYKSDLVAVLESNPDILLDDGGDLAQLLHTDYKKHLVNLIGGSEETTTGVMRLKSLENENKLLYPVIAVNDAKCKHLFDNRYGTGQSTLTAIMATTNLIIANKKFVVAGYGMCGKGIAMRAAGMGAQVIVTEIDPVKACEALMDGFSVMTMDQAAKIGDIFVTVTGCKDVITSSHYSDMKNGAILANAGHFDVEINIKDLEQMSKMVFEQRKNVEGYLINDDKTINLLAKGRLVNLASGDGHPVEIMDMSFSLQALSLEYILLNKGKLDIKVYDIPDEIDNKVAKLLLKSKAIKIDELTQEQKHYLNHWDI